MPLQVLPGRGAGPKPRPRLPPPPVARRFPAAVPGDAANMLQKREKVLLLRTFQGRTLRIVREHYLRPSVPCNSPLCPQPAACRNGQGREGPGRPGPEEGGRTGSEEGGRPEPEEKGRPASDVARELGPEREARAEGKRRPRLQAQWEPGPGVVMATGH